MADKRILVEYPIIDNPDANVLRLTLEYRLGGHNWFTGENNPRGLFLSCSPLGVNKDKDGIVTTSYRGFSGTNMHVKEMKRFSQKTLDTFEPSKEDIKRLVDHVIREQNLTVEGYE